jgi:hypothetical protein
MKHTVPMVLLLATTVSVSAQLALTTFDPTVVDFTGYTGAGFQAAPAAGQLDSDMFAITGFADGSLAFGGTQTAGDYARGTASAAVSTGGLYNFSSMTINGGTGAFGIQPVADDFTPGTVTLKIVNQTGLTLTGLTLSYEIWVRNDQGRGNSLNFSHSSDDASYAAVTALDFTSADAADTLGFQKTDRGVTLSGLSIADGANYYLRWTGDDSSGAGFRDEFALDNISITAVPEPGSYALWAGLALCGVAAWHRRRSRRAPC